jgi:hypothetical protein
MSSSSLSPGVRQKVLPDSGCAHASGGKGDDRNIKNICGAVSGSALFSNAVNLFSISLAVIFDSHLLPFPGRKVVVQMWKAVLLGCGPTQSYTAFHLLLRRSPLMLPHLSRIQ